MVLVNSVSSSKGILYTLGSVLAWATTPVAARLLLNNSPVVELLLFNSFFATILFIGLCGFQGRLKEFRQYSKKDFINFFNMGLLGIFLSYLSLFIAINIMSPQKAFIMNYTWPLMMVVLATVFLKEHMTIIKFIGVLISFIGLVVVVSEGDFAHWDFSIKGTVFALFGAFSYAIYSIKSKKVHYDQLLATTAMIIFYFLLSVLGFVGSSLYIVIIKGDLTSWIPSMSFSQLGGYIFMGMIPNGLGYYFWMKALHHSDISRISNIIYLTPFVSLLFIRIVLGNPIFISSIVGVTIIVAGIFLEKIVTKKIFVPELD